MKVGRLIEQLQIMTLKQIQDYVKNIQKRDLFKCLSSKKLKVIMKEIILTKIKKIK